MYVLRDLLQFSTNLSTSVEMLQNAHRTWEIYVGVGSKDQNQLYGFDYAAHEFNVWSDMNYTREHPVMEGIFYFTSNGCLYETLNASYGYIDAEYLFRVVAPYRKTGDTLLAIYDFKNEGVYIAWSNCTT